jgi:hypothetical protein
MQQRVFQDDLFTVSSPRLRAMGVIRPEAASAMVAFGDGDDAFTREIKTWHRKWVSLFICPWCGGKARILRLFDGAPRCRNCLCRAGIQFRIAYGTPAERAEARTRRIEKLQAKLNGGPLRLHPRKGRGVERRRALELSLRRAQVVERLGLLEEVERWRGRQK